MSKRTKISLVIAFFLVAGGLTTWWMLGTEEGDVHVQLYTAVTEGDTEAVLGQLHAELRADIDEPILAAWIAAVRKHLGAFVRMAPGKSSSELKTENGRDIVKSAGIAEFERGDAESRLKLFDGKIIAWNTWSEQLPDTWFSDVVDTTSYDRRSKSFLNALFSADRGTMFMLGSPHLREQINRPGFGKQLEKAYAFYKTATGVTLSRHTFTPGKAPSLTLHYRPEGMPPGPDGQPAPDNLTVTWVFQGMRGVLNEFNVPIQRR